jgi:gliding motility-associated-like protein
MRTLFLLISIWISNLTAFAQLDSTIIYTDAQRISCSGIVDVPIKASKFRKMLSMQGTIAWDTAVFRFDSLSNYGPAALNLQPAQFGTTQTSQGRLYFSWNDPSLAGITLTDSATLFTLRMTVRVRAATASQISIGGDVVPLEFIDTSYTPIRSAGRSVRIDLLFQIPGYNPFSDTTRICGTGTPLNAGIDSVQYLWSTGATIRTIDVNKNGRYSVKVTNTLGCTATDTTLVSLVTASIIPRDTTLCATRPYKLTAATGTGWTYRWSTGDTGSVLNRIADTTRWVKLTVSDGIGSCTDSVRVTVTPLNRDTTRANICANKVPYFWKGKAFNTTGTYNDTLKNTIGGCDTVAILVLTVDTLPKRTFNVAVCANKVPYTWNGKTYADAGTYIDTLKNVSGGCDTVGTLILSVNPLLTSNTRDSICANKFPYLWKGKSYAAPGTYIDTLKNVTGGCDTVATLVLKSNPLLAFEQAVTVCANQLPYLWKGKSYTAAGTFLDTLQNKTGGCDTAAVLTLKVNPLNRDTVRAEVCENKLPYRWNGKDFLKAGVYIDTLPSTQGCDTVRTLQLLVNPVNRDTTKVLVCAPNLPYKWRGRDYKLAGIYFDTIPGLQRCDTFAVLDLKVSMIDTSLSIQGSLAYCDTKDSVVLFAGQGAAYRWFRDGKLITGATSSRYRPDSSGVYRALVTNADGCADSTRAVKVSIFPLPNVTLQSSGDSILCEGSPRLLVALGADLFRWYQNDSLLLITGRDSVYVNQSGRYKVEGYTLNGCVSVGKPEYTFTLVTRGVASFTVTGVCADVPLKFTNTSNTPSQGMMSWSWTFGDGRTSTLASPENVYRDTGNYTVRLQYRSNLCPEHVDTATRLIRVKREPNVRFNDAIAVRRIEKLVMARDTATSWLWRPATGLTSTTVYDPKAVLDVNQQYVIETKLKNGCMVYDSLLVKVANETNVHVPKGFSPNGDGQNDKLFPILVGINTMRYFRVYNRWGNMIYEVTSINPSMGWDGKYKGANQPMDTYVWVVEVVDVLGKTIKKSGNTILIR